MWLFNSTHFFSSFRSNRRWTNTFEWKVWLLTASFTYNYSCSSVAWDCCLCESAINENSSFQTKGCIQGKMVIWLSVCTKIIFVYIYMVTKQNCMITVQTQIKKVLKSENIWWWIYCSLIENEFWVKMISN